MVPLGIHLTSPPGWVGLTSLRVDRLDIRKRFAQAAQAALQRRDVGWRELRADRA